MARGIVDMLARCTPGGSMGGLLSQVLGRL
jgi:hypothetical protein